MEPNQLQDSLLQHLLDEIKDYAIFIIDVNGKISTWNKGVKAVFGYDEQEFVGQQFSIIFTDEDKSIGLPDAELGRARTETRAEDERWHKRKDGHHFWANGVVSLMKDEAGEILGYTKVVRDQTKRKRLEEDLISQSNALIETNQELSRYAELVSHDLRAPLQTVYGFANVLREHDLDGEERESVEQIASSAEKMIKLVSETLNNMTGKSETEDSFVASDTVLQDSLLNLKAAITDANAQVTHDSLPPVCVDPTMLGRIFQNLIQNAIAYTRDGESPEVHVGFEKGNEEIIFSVSDRGVGIPDSHKQKVFTMFKRLQKNIRGTGLGLATCKRIVERWGGRIWVQDNEPYGSRFLFSIPNKGITTGESESAVTQRNRNEDSVMAVQ